ncbi:phage portal protein [Enterobacter roggenkampii]|uniref:phage portal protein n=1 Tax=Enterobacter roggenkampii TaxID=1812935 RepID=UPI00244AF608|nr:phage portal protein [Enterobacter roggenkampii]WGG56842.1 phage portal protein [Enterobacter roggenkampii]
MWNPFRRKEKALQQPPSGVWTPLFSFVREPFGGAWQRNMEVRNETVLSYYAVFSCITLIASDIAKMSPAIQSKDSNGIWKDISDASFDTLIAKPNQFQNTIQFFETWMNSKLSRGNTYVMKVKNNAGKITELRILDPDKVIPLVADDGSVFYQISPDQISGLPTQVTVPAREIIHDRFNCLFHPLIGISPIYACGLAAMQGKHIQESSAFFFKNGGKPSGVITIPGAVDAEKAKEIKAAWDAGYTGENAGKTGLLSGGAEYKAITMSAVDAQTVEQQKLSAEMVCSAFHVPAYKAGVGEIPSSDNVEALEQQYYSQCLQVLIESIEALLKETFDLGQNKRVELDIGALLRMDSERRMKALGEGVKNTILTPNEARKSENLPPVDGGDALYLQQQNFSLPALARRDASDNPFGKNTSDPTPPAKSAISLVEKSFVKTSLRGIINNG